MSGTSSEGIVRWSPNPFRDEFMVFNLNNRVAQLYEATGYAQPQRFDYKKVSKHTELPLISTYDWSPSIRGLVAAGTSQGEVHLLRVDDNSNAQITLPLKLQRPCQSVSFNTTGLIAVGLDRVRNDACLQIWDVNQRLADWDSNQKGWKVSNMSIEPRKKLEGSTSITSIRWFEDQPQTLVAGVKNQSVKVHDLRDPTNSAIVFQTRCNNNIAIDYTDSNYFASSSLDQPGLVVWDRRVASHPVASPMYKESVEHEELPWGAGLKLDTVIESEKNVFIKQLRFSRAQRGALGALSTGGQLSILQTRKEYIEPGSSNDIQGSPQLLEVASSYDLENPYLDQYSKRRGDQKIVSFDWLNTDSPIVPSRVVALRANGEFEILQMPASTASHLSQLIPWKPPHNTQEPYMTLMNVKDLNEREQVVGPLYAAAALSDIPIYGPGRLSSKKATSMLAEKLKDSLESVSDPVMDLLSLESAVDSQFNNNFEQPIKAEQERSKMEIQEDAGRYARTKQSKDLHSISIGYDGADDRRSAPTTKSQFDQHDHLMLLRAIEGYLFDSEKNKSIVVENRGLEHAWNWVTNAEKLAAEDGMVSNPLDLNYLGIFSIWTNLLGEKTRSRLIESIIVPDIDQWERLIAKINQQAGRPDFKGVDTSRPHHRQLCLATAGLLRTQDELEEQLKTLEDEKRFTRAAAWALFEGLPERAVEILNQGDTDLVFVAMALDIKIKSNSSMALDNAKWGKALANNPQMAKDPYLKAIYNYIATGAWTGIVEEKSLPLLARVGIALRKLDDEKLTEWLTHEMASAIQTGDIEGIVLAGITDEMVDILARYIEISMDYQTAALVMSFAYPRYIQDTRCDAWRSSYKDFLQRHKKYLLRVKFEQQSTIKSRLRDGTPVIKPPPRQVTIRCLNCDANSANDLENSKGTIVGSTQSSRFVDHRNPLQAAGINAGLCCPRCGAHLARCAICMETVGVPRSDRPAYSTDPKVRRMANFPTFCLKCKHVMHMDHSIAWFNRHVECPVPECHCQCNETPGRQTT